MIKINTAAVLNKEMDRMQFIKSVGLGVLVLTGVAAALDSFLKFGGKAPKSQTVGYGTSVYGGRKTS